MASYDVASNMWQAPPWGRGRAPPPWRPRTRPSPWPPRRRSPRPWAPSCPRPASSPAASWRTRRPRWRRRAPFRRAWQILLAASQDDAIYLRQETKVKLRVDDVAGYLYFPGPTSAATAGTSAGAAAAASRSVAGATGAATVGGSLASPEGQIQHQVQFEF